jgi:hypothetical protein
MAALLWLSVLAPAALDQIRQGILPALVLVLVLVAEFRLDIIEAVLKKRASCSGLSLHFL